MELFISRKVATKQNNHLKTENIETFFLVSVFKVPTERPLQHVNEEKYLENKPENNFLQENLHRYGVTVMFFM